MSVVEGPRTADRLGRGALLEPRVERHQTLIEVFERTAARWPLRTALEAPDAGYSYAELAVAAATLAQRLAAAGVGRGDRVVVRVRSGSSELYVAILGVLAAGAAYVPIDADDPPERATDITLRSGACATIGDGLTIECIGSSELLTTSSSERLTIGSSERLTTGSSEPLTASAGPTTPGAPAGTGGEPTPDDDAWIIFTSGTTGKPKGVAVTHANAAAFIDGESQLWDVFPSDRVLAGLSVGFDASCEEIWLAWAHGAALVPAPRAVVRAGVELGNWLIDNRITVVSTVPTLAALWDESCLHRVRLLILGGEACPEKLGWRLSAGREVWNTYGPTEATVVSTAAPVLPGLPITIGAPLDGWEVAVLDEDGEPAPSGEAGELVIAGAGLARYLDPELDASRYAGVEALGWERAYRTGDMVRETPDGLQFVGRRDDQVKIGGRRIELGEVESVLQSAHGVRAAAVAIRETAAGNKLLVGYVVCDGGGDGDRGGDGGGDAQCDCEQIRVHAARRLPGGMVPMVVAVPDLPKTGSGKVDRRALPWPVGGDADALAAGIGADGTLLTDHEIWLGEQWVAQLGPVAITPNSDFFALGGTSLAAAKLISALRHRHPTVAVADLYKHPTLRTLAQRLETLGTAGESTTTVRAEARTLTRCLQLCVLLALLVTDIPGWMAGILAFDRWYHVGPQIAWGWIIAAWLILANPFTRTLFAAGLRRAVMSGLEPGRYPRNGWTAFRVTFVDRLAGQLHLDQLAGTPWAARYARHAGLEVGDNARLGVLPPASALVRIGAGATIEGGVDMHGWWIEGDALVIGEVQIGENARIGTRALLMPGAIIEAGAEIEPGAVITGRVPAGERWAGAPARCVGRAGDHWPTDPAPADGSASARFWRAMFAGGLFLRMLLPLLGSLPSIGLILLVEGNGQASTTHLVRTMLMFAPVIALVFTLSMALTIAVSVRALGHLIKPGWHAGFGATGWALWMTDILMAESRAVLFPLYASSFTNRWLRLCGIHLGDRTEVSNVVGLNRLTRFGSTCFAADDVDFVTTRERDGWLQVAGIEIGDRTFLGNSAIIEPGTRIGDDCLIGLMTVAPRAGHDGTAWLGAPALELPRKRPNIDASRTTNPSRRLRAQRRAMDVIRILLPSSVAVIAMLMCYRGVEWMAYHVGLGAMAAAIVPALILVGIFGTLFTVAVKWLLMGRYHASEHPFFSGYVWRDEIVNTCQEQLAGPMLMELGLGTVLMTLYLRLMGARVGRDVWVENMNTTEFDLACFDDGAVVNRGSVVETHLFHDRVMSTGAVRIGAGSTLGPMSVSLPDTTIHDGTAVGGRAIVMRGEELPPGTRWHGAPVVPR